MFNPHRKRRYQKRLYQTRERWSVVLFTVLVVVMVMVLQGRSHATLQPSQSLIHAKETKNEVVTEPQRLPESAPHPLPSTLASWADPEQTGDYFDHIQATRFGYLVWSQFPVTIYLDSDPPSDSQVDIFGEPTRSPSGEQQQQWVDVIESAIAEWTQYLPLVRIFEPGNADIEIVASAPPLQWEHLLNRNSSIYTSKNGNTQQREASTSSSDPALITRAQTAETTYHLYWDTTSSPTPVLKQRYEILLSPHQTPSYLVATARHELGHALGIWGHSPLDSDALYFSQVRTPQGISARDINTLKKIYQQPTQIGWSLPTHHSSYVEHPLVGSGFATFSPHSARRRPPQY